MARFAEARHSVEDYVSLVHRVVQAWYRVKQWTACLSTRTTFSRHGITSHIRLCVYLPGLTFSRYGMSDSGLSVYLPGLRFRGTVSCQTVDFASPRADISEVLSQTGDCIPPPPPTQLVEAWYHVKQ